SAARSTTGSLSRLPSAARIVYTAAQKDAGAARLDKLFASVDAAVADIPDGASVMVGGFVGVGAPWDLIGALVRHGAKNLTCIQTATRVEMTPLIEAGLVSRMITSF